MRVPPLLVILTWPPPNYEDPVTRGNALIVVNAIFVALVVLAVALRYYARVAIKKWFGSDDVLIGLALLFTLGMTAVVLLANLLYGWDRHVWDIPPSKIQKANVIAFAAKIMFTMAATFTRLSLLSFYFRLVKDSGVRWFVWVLRLSIVWVLGVCVAFVALTIWQCKPISAYWVYPPMPNGTCMDEGTVTLWAGVINCISDLLVTVLPIPIVMRLQMPLKERLGVVVLLSLGFAVTVAGVVRTYSIWWSLIKSWDETWFAYPLWIAAAVEIDLAVICACAPALKPLIWPPLTQLSHSLSSRLSLLRSQGPSRKGSPMSSQTSAPTPTNNNNTNTFNPLRPLARLLHPSYSSENGEHEKRARKTTTAHRDAPLDLERDGARPATTTTDEGEKAPLGAAEDVGAHRSRTHSTTTIIATAATAAARPLPTPPDHAIQQPGLYITKRQSVDLVSWRRVPSGRGSDFASSRSTRSGAEEGVEMRDGMGVGVAGVRRGGAAAGTEERESGWGGPGAGVGRRAETVTTVRSEGDVLSGGGGGGVGVRKMSRTG
ncbi:hypothetical protein LTR28_004249 [Elasticomyces elasticus]|nr:hypothetical protein LTR28_004249 [Elasticomyces elasticus]